jgi:hypothetical protein
MPRNPRSHRPGTGDQPPNHMVGDPPAAGEYPLRRGGRAVPDRSREPVIGPSCVDTDYVGPPVVVNPETNASSDFGSTRGNNEPVPKTTQDYGDMVREARGVRTRPVRPGQAPA